MIKTTRKECLNMATFIIFDKLKEYLNKNNIKVLNVEKIAYCESVYGCGGYLLRFEFKDFNYPIFAFTGRSSWIYNCTSLEQYNNNK